MLSRTAENLYWISRYMERAETTARLIDVGYRMSLFPHPNGHNNEWESVLAAAGAMIGYKEKYNSITQKNVEDYLFFDEGNPSSIYNCILNARKNALIVRTSFTPESWLAINKSYQEILKLKDLEQSLLSTKKSAIFVAVTLPSYAHLKARNDDKDLSKILH